VGVSPIAGWMGIISWGYPIFMVHKCDGSRFLPFQKWGVFFLDTPEKPWWVDFMQNQWKSWNVIGMLYGGFLKWGYPKIDGF
jgi:hypothetical protein